MSRTLLFSVTSKDFDTQCFSVGGSGGSGKDTSNSGVRLVHRASGAVGEGRESRSMIQNRRAAFTRLIETPKFKQWHKIECAKRLGRVVSETAEEIRVRVNREVDDALKDGRIKIEYGEV